eukprot:scaffold72053_cov63-Phaeocystis_antarctica.AAC.3
MRTPKRPLSSCQLTAVPTRPLSDAFDRLCSRTVAPTLGRHSGETVGAGVGANVGAGCGRRRSEGALRPQARSKFWICMSLLISYGVGSLSMGPMVHAMLFTSSSGSWARPGLSGSCWRMAKRHVIVKAWRVARAPNEGQREIPG